MWRGRLSHQSDGCELDFIIFRNRFLYLLEVKNIRCSVSCAYNRVHGYSFRRDDRAFHSSLYFVDGVGVGSNPPLHSIPIA